MGVGRVCSVQRCLIGKVYVQSLTERSMVMTIVDSSPPNVIRVRVTVRVSVRVGVSVRVSEY